MIKIDLERKPKWLQGTFEMELPYSEFNRRIDKKKRWMGRRWTTVINDMKNKAHVRE